MINSSETDYQPDVRMLCEKFNIGQHTFVMVMAELCRLSAQSPRQMLVTLEKVEDIYQYATELKFKSLNENQPDFEDYDFDFE